MQYEQCSYSSGFVREKINFTGVYTAPTWHGPCIFIAALRGDGCCTLELCQLFTLVPTATRKVGAVFFMLRRKSAACRLWYLYFCVFVVPCRCGLWGVFGVCYYSRCRESFGQPLESLWWLLCCVFLEGRMVSSMRRCLRQ